MRAVLVETNYTSFLFEHCVYVILSQKEENVRVISWIKST